MANSVKFIKVALKATYDNLVEKDVRALYFIEETNEFFVGSKLYGTGALVTEEFAGLLSPVDYAEIKKLIGFSTITDLQAVAAEDVHKYIPTVGAVLEAISEVTGGAELVPIATREVAGKVKASDEIIVAADGTMSIGVIEQAKIAGLTDTFADVYARIETGVPKETISRIESLEDSMSWDEM